MKRSTAKALSIISTILFLVIECILIPSGSEVGKFIAFFVYLPIAFVLLHFQRCRHCGRWPRRGDFFDTYCPGCGEPLDD